MLKIKSFIRFLMVLFVCVSFSHGVFAQTLIDFCDAQDINSLHEYTQITGFSCTGEEKAWIECNDKYICGQCNFEDTDVAIYINEDEQKICGHLDASFAVSTVNAGGSSEYKRAFCNYQGGEGVYFENGSAKCGQCAGDQVPLDTTYLENNLWKTYDLGKCVDCINYGGGYGITEQDHVCRDCFLSSNGVVKDGYCVSDCNYNGYSLSPTGNVCENCADSGQYEWLKACVSSCPTGTISIEDRSVKYCSTCPSQFVYNDTCLNECPHGTRSINGDYGLYCGDCPADKPYSYDGSCYAGKDCPGATFPSEDSNGRKYCKNCGSDSVGLELFKNINGDQNLADKICIAKTVCNGSDNNNIFGNNFKVDDASGKCVPKCENQNCINSVSDCTGSQGVGDREVLYDSYNQYFLKTHYGCRNCNSNEMLIPAIYSGGNPVCSQISSSACNNGVTWKKDDDSVTTCYSCDALNMDSGCTSDYGVNGGMLYGKPNAGYYFETDRTVEPTLCEYTESNKKCWVEDPIDGNHICENCDLSKIIITPQGNKRYAEYDSHQGCSDGEYIMNGSCTPCTGTTATGQYKGVNSAKQCNACGNDEFVAFVCENKTGLYPSCNGGTVKGQQCVSKTDTMFSELIGKTGFEDYKNRGFLDNKTNSIQLCNLSVVHPTCTTGVCINGDNNGNYGVGIYDDGISRTCEKCGEGFASIPQGGGIQRCVSCGSSGPKVINVNGSGNDDGGSFSITSDVYYFTCSTTCKYTNWGRKDNRCVKCVNEGLLWEQDDREGENRCASCPDGSGWNTDKCVTCSGVFGSYKGKCMKWEEFRDAVNPRCKDNPTYTTCTTRNPFYVPDGESIIKFHDDLWKIENGKVVFKEGVNDATGNPELDNPNRYYKETLGNNKGNVWTPCSIGCCYGGERFNVGGLMSFTLPGMACKKEENKKVSYLNCSDISTKMRSGMNTYETRINDIFKESGYQYDEDQITNFIIDNVCNNNVNIKKFCSVNTSNCFNIDDMDFINLIQYSSKNLHYSMSNAE